MAILDASFLADPSWGGPRGGPGPTGGAGGEGRVPLSTTPTSALEQYLRAHLSGNPEKNLEAAKKILASLPVLPLDDEAAIIFGALSARLWSEGRRIGDFDEVIAAIALCNDQEIVTRDGHFREVAGW
jgi:tRNA(fMet)-specific endonuclease VapC